MYDKYVELRNANNIKSDNAFCEASGLSKAIISDWKNNKSVPDTSTLQKVFGFFGYTFDVVPKDETNKLHYVSDFEFAIITAFRNNRSIQASVLKLLDVEEPKEQDKKQTIYPVLSKDEDAIEAEKLLKKERDNVDFKKDSLKKNGSATGK